MKAPIFLVSMFVLGCLTDGAVEKLFPSHDHRLDEVVQLTDELTRERVELDRMQRRLAAYDASNKVAEDEIRLLQSNPQP